MAGTSAAFGGNASGTDWPAGAHVYMGEASHRLQSEPERVYPLLGKLLLRLGALELLPMIRLGGVGPWLFSLVFGPQWIEAGVYARLLAPRVLTQFMVFPVSHIFNLTKRQGVQLGWNASHLAALFAILLASP